MFATVASASLFSLVVIQRRQAFLLDAALAGVTFGVFVTPKTDTCLSLPRWQKCASGGEHGLNAQARCRHANRPTLARPDVD
jgi:hypothetical protein